MDEEKNEEVVKEEKVNEEVVKEKTENEPKKEQNNKGLIIGIIAVVVLILVIVLCVSKNNGGIGAKKVDITGNYTLTEMYDGEEDQSEDLELLKSLGITATLEVNEDGTGALVLFDEKMEFTYDDKNIIVVNEDGTEETAEYTYEDNKITFEEDGTKLVFVNNNVLESESVENSKATK